MLISSLVVAISGVVSTIRKTLKDAKESNGTSSVVGLFKLLNCYLYWIEHDPYMTKVDKEKIGRGFKDTINGLTERFYSFSSSLSTTLGDNNVVTLERELADCLTNLLAQYSRYKGSFKNRNITNKQNIYESLVMHIEDAELMQLKMSETPATKAFDTESARVQVTHRLDLTSKSGLSRAYQLQSCNTVKQYITDNLHEPELSFVLSPPVVEWLEEMRETYETVSTSTFYSIPKAVKGVIIDVDKLLLEMVLWQRNVDAFATSVVAHRQDSDERDRLIQQAEARLKERESTSCCKTVINWFS